LIVRRRLFVVVYINPLYTVKTITSVSPTPSSVFGAALLSAALLLPSMQFAYADAAPERGVISLKYLNYQDSQSADTPVTANLLMSRDRIAVNALSIMAVMPVASEWSVGVSFMEDSVTGASPAYHSGFPVNKSDVKSGASGELRHAADLQLTRYFPQGSVTAGTSYSKESDYVSRSCSLQGSLSTEDKNTTFTLGGSFNNDSIDLNKPNVVLSKQQLAEEKKQVFAGLVGVTRVLTKKDIVQLNMGYSNGNGYYTDPYKDPDNRPRDRNSFTALGRWNHHFDGTDGTAKLSYRYYSDTFGIRAHTLDAEYVQPLHHGWTLTPLLRLYTQSEADFYFTVAEEQLFNTDGTPKVPITTGPYYTEDQRLSAFGAVTLGLKISKQLNPDWLVDLKIEKYQQRDEWSLSGSGDPGLATFNARSIQIGLSRKI
jgi:Protein of unknown function (DUF3570)